MGNFLCYCRPFIIITIKKNSWSTCEIPCNDSENIRKRNTRGQSLKNEYGLSTISALFCDSFYFIGLPLSLGWPY